MRIKVITCVSNAEHHGLHKLESSLKRFNYDYKIIIDPNINWNWGGLKNIWEWCQSEEAKDYTHFLYTDGFDTLALEQSDLLYERYGDTECILFSGEKACFPQSSWATIHPESTRWKFINHGQFIAPIHLFVDMYNGVFDYPITCQEWAMAKYLFGDCSKIKIDTNCQIFQSIAFIADDEFAVGIDDSGDGHLYNRVLNVHPLFAHGNGRSEMGWVYDILKDKP